MILVSGIKIQQLVFLCFDFIHQRSFDVRVETTKSETLGTSSREYDFTCVRVDLGTS